ncbi:secretion system protein, partial [Micromonospora chalcea]
MSRQMLAAVCLGGAASLLLVAVPAARPARRLRRLAPAPRRPRPAR